MQGRPELDKIRRAIEKEDDSEQSSANRRREIEKAEQVAQRIGPTGAGQKPAQGFVQYRPNELELDRLELTGKEPSRVAKSLLATYFRFKLLLKPLARLSSNLPAARELKGDLNASLLNYSPQSYLAISTTASFIYATAMATFLLTSLAVIGVAPAISFLFATSTLILGFTVMQLILVTYPSVIASRRAASIDRELPFALRHLSTQIKAGVPFQKAMESVERGGYGLLSVEIRHFLISLEGQSSEDALNALYNRTKSKGLRQAVMQINRALRTGGTLSTVINAIASDVTFETQSRIRDFSERLNLVSIVFTMAAVVLPVVVTVIASIIQLPLLGGGISQAALVAAFGAIACLSGAILYYIKTIEPTA